MKVSQHFTRSEFECDCGCGFDSADKILVETLERTREHFVNKYPDKRIAVIITSGNRCKERNHHIGGSKNSYHVRGMAADFYIKNVSHKEVQEYLLATYPNWFGIGSYQHWTHLDVRNTPARWTA